MYTFLVKLNQMNSGICSSHFRHVFIKHDGPRFVLRIVGKVGGDRGDKLKEAGPLVGVDGVHVCLAFQKGTHRPNVVELAVAQQKLEHAQCYGFIDNFVALALLAEIEGVPVEIEESRGWGGPGQRLMMDQYEEGEEGEGGGRED